MCERKAGICPLPVTQTCSALLPCHWGFAFLLCSYMVPSPLWPRSFLGWFQCPSKTPWTLGIFQQLPQMRIYLDWASYYKSGGYQRFPWGLPNGRLPVDFSLACHPRRLGHSSQSNVQTFCSLPSDTLRLRSWDQMTLLCSKRGLGWWRMMSSPN